MDADTKIKVKSSFFIYILTFGKGLIRIGLKIDGIYYTVRALNRPASNKCQKWYKKHNQEGTSDEVSMDALHTLISNKKNFEVKKNSKEAYSEYLEIEQNVQSELFKNLINTKHPARPSESVELLTKWFNDVINIDKDAFIVESIDQSPEMLKQLEILQIERQMESITIKYLGISSVNRHTEQEIIANKAFLEWLITRKANLENVGEDGENEVVPDEIQQKVAWLYAIGVVDYITEKHKILGTTMIGKILAKGMGAKADTVRKTLDRIENDGLMSKYDDIINDTCHTYKIKRVR